MRAQTPPEIDKLLLDFRVNTYVLGVVDLLAQADKLKGLERLPRTDDETRRFANTFDETVGRVDSVRREFRKYFEQVMRGERGDAVYSSFTPEQRNVCDAASSFEVDLQCFSDTIVMYSPLVNPAGDPTVLAVLAMCYATGSILCAALSTGLAYRGAIEIGVGTNYWRREVYGPVLRDAHHLESRVAKYPRIVVGPNAMQYLKDTVERKRTSDMARLNHALAQLVCSVIQLDGDGKPIVDYLGKPFRNWINAGDDGMAVARRGLEFISSEQQRFIRGGNAKLANRYERLKRYYERSLANWEQESCIR